MTAGTVAEALAVAARAADAGIRLVDRHERAEFASWADIRSRAGRVGGALRALGVRGGDRVAVVFPTGEPFLAAFFGAIASGAVPVPLPPPPRIGGHAEYPGSTGAMLRGAGARVVLIAPRMRASFAPAVAAAGIEIDVRTLEDLPDAPPYEHVTAKSDDVAIVQFSSGSTVRPKPVALSHRAVLTHARTLDRLWPEQPERHTGVSWLPLYHDMGLIGCLFPALVAPTVLTLLATESFVARPAVWLQTISRYRASISPAPNFAFALAHDRITDAQMDAVDLSCWRVAPNGAEPIAPDVLRAFERRFSRWGLRRETLTPVYGLAEASLALTFSEPGRRFRTGRFDRGELARSGRAVPDPGGVELVAVGRPVPATELRIVGRGGGECPERRIGRVYARGPSLMTGYLGMPDETERVLRDGWLDTGDLGFLEDGELYLTGRAKDVVILRGRNYDPAWFEEAAGKTAGIRSGRIVAAGRRPEGGSGEQLWLFAEPRAAGREPDPTGLAERCRIAVLNATGVDPDRVVLVARGAIPRTTSGKVRRGETVRRFESGTLALAGPR